MRHFQSRCQTVRAQHVSDLEDLGAFWQVRKIDCYSLSSTFFFFFSSSCFLVCSSQHPQIKLWRCGIVKQARGLKDWKGILPLWIPVTQPGGAPTGCTGSDDGTVKVGVVCLCWGFLRWQMLHLPCLPTYAIPFSPQLCFIKHFPKQTLFKIHFR